MKFIAAFINQPEVESYPVGKIAVNIIHNSCINMREVQDHTFSTLQLDASMHKYVAGESAGSCPAAFQLNAAVHKYAHSKHAFKLLINQ